LTGITPVSIGTLVESGNPAFGQPTTAGNLLLAWVCTNSSSSTFDITCNDVHWVNAANGGGGFDWASIWYRPNCGTAETAPQFSSGGSDLWAQLGEFHGAATSSVFEQAASGATAQTFTAADTEGGELITAAVYWNGSLPGGTVIVAVAGDGQAQFIDSDGGTIAGTLTSAGNGNGQYAASLFGVAGITGSVPHTTRLALTVFSGAQGCLASFRPASPLSSPLTGVTTTLPGRFTGIPYQGSFPVGPAVTGGTPPYTWTVTAGSLPTGLSISSSTGYITGTPTVAGTYNFTVQVADSAAASVNMPLSIAITASPAVVSSTTYPPTQQTFWFVPAPDPQFTGIGPPLLVNVNPNVWGPVPGETQTQNVQSARQWDIVISANNASASVTCFPNTGAQFPLDSPITWQDLSCLISGWDVYMDTDADIVASACYDLWFDEPFIGQVSGVLNSAEVMAHFDLRNRGDFNFAHGVQFGGYTIAGHDIPATTWSLAYTTGDGAAYWNIGNPPGTYASMDTGALDWKPMFQYLVDHAILPATARLKGFSIGYEVCDTAGNTNTFVYNDAWWHAVTPVSGPVLVPSIVNRAVSVPARIG